MSVLKIDEVMNYVKSQVREHGSPEMNPNLIWGNLRRFYDEEKSTEENVETMKRMLKHHHRVEAGKKAEVPPRGKREKREVKPEGGEEEFTWSQAKEKIPRLAEFPPQDEYLGKKYSLSAWRKYLERAREEFKKAEKLIGSPPETKGSEGSPE